MRGLPVCLAVVLASCAAPTGTTTGPATSAVSPPAATSAPTSVRPPPEPTPRATFPPGLYVVKPALDHPGGTIELLEGAGPLPAQASFGGVGFDVSADFVISAQGDTLTLARADGTTQRMSVKGLYGMGRPSLSPDAKQVFLQAGEVPSGPGVKPPMVDTVYIVDLATGSWRRIGDSAVPGDASTQSEQPGWFPSGDRVAYWAVASQCLVIKVRDAATAKDLVQLGRNGTTGCYQPQRGILDGPRFHVSVSHDSSRILIPGQMQLYDARTGALLADIRKQVMDGLAAAGYKPDARFPGAAGGGTFPLSGTFSPDDRVIAFDGAVERDGSFGLLLCKVNVDGTGFTVVRPPVPSEPKFSNNHNFSQLLPHWR